MAEYTEDTFSLGRVETGDLNYWHRLPRLYGTALSLIVTVRCGEAIDPGQNQKLDWALWSSVTSEGGAFVLVNALQEESIVKQVPSSLKAIRMNGPFANRVWIGFYSEDHFGKRCPGIWEDVVLGVGTLWAGPAPAKEETQ